MYLEYAVHIPFSEQAECDRRNDDSKIVLPPMLVLKTFSGTSTASAVTVTDIINPGGPTTSIKVAAACT